MADEKPRGPTGLERMKRPPPSDLRLRPKKFEFDPKKAYQKKQLAELGAISIVWNQIEGQIDYLASWRLFPKAPFEAKLEIDNVVGLSGKVALLRAFIKKTTVLDDDARKCIELVLQGLLEYRAYRNAVIHHHIYDPKKGIASYVDERGKASQVLVSYEALSGLYKRLRLLRDEIISIELLFIVGVDTDSLTMVDPSTRRRSPVPHKLLREVTIPGAIETVRLYQQERLSLPPLPLFPDAHRVRPRKAVAGSRRRSSEKGRVH